MEKEITKKSKKELILEIAIEHFSKYGYSNTTLDGIASECGITKPAIYYHFRDKAALYEAVTCSQFSLVVERIEKLTRTGSPVERLGNYISAFGEFLISNPSFNAIFAREIADGAKTLPAKCTKILSGTLKMLVSILDDGKKEGLFADENPFMLQMMIVSTLTSYNTPRPLRDRIVKGMENEQIKLEAHFENVIDDLSKKIIKALTC